MDRLRREEIVRALESLARELSVGPSPIEMVVVWRLVTPHLVPGRELKAQYAFLDLWEAHRAS